MRYIFLTLFLSFTSLIHAQHKPQAVLANELYNIIEKRDRPSFIVYWNPNCETGEEQLVKYQRVINKYGAKIDIYVIALTNMSDLIADMSKKIGLDYPLYYLGGDQARSLILRKLEFSSVFLHLTKLEGDDFNYIYLKDIDHVEQENDIFEIDYSRLDALYQ
ncbi:MAG: hypothetical protein LBI72_01320 [Flavobacteriaceae bacterium]|jgi:thiol-disulfide isomerase/thioredoxin|nr:hypothetical protein [Flavobacteriaceae bacterium]